MNQLQYQNKQALFTDPVFSDGFDLMNENSFFVLSVIFVTFVQFILVCCDFPVWSFINPRWRCFDSWYYALKSVHFKNPVARSSFLSKSLSFSIRNQLNQNKVSWCILENDHIFEGSEDHATHTVILEYFNIKELALSNFAFKSF